MFEGQCEIACTPTAAMIQPTCDASCQGTFPAGWDIPDSSRPLCTNTAPEPTPKPMPDSVTIFGESYDPAMTTGMMMASDAVPLLFDEPVFVHAGRDESGTSQPVGKVP